MGPHTLSITSRIRPWFGLLVHRFRSDFIRWSARESIPRVGALSLAGTAMGHTASSYKTLTIVPVGTLSHPPPCRCSLHPTTRGTSCRSGESCPRPGPATTTRSSTPAANIGLSMSIFRTCTLPLSYAPPLTKARRASLSHTFTSRADYQSDATYVFPLPPDASVHAFEAHIDGHAVHGIVQDRTTARATFERAVSMNQKAALLQQENVESALAGPRNETGVLITRLVFKIMLGNIMPGQTITVQSV